MENTNFETNSSSFFEHLGLSDFENPDLNTYLTNIKSGSKIFGFGTQRSISTSVRNSPAQMLGEKNITFHTYTSQVILNFQIPHDEVVILSDAVTEDVSTLCKKFNKKFGEDEIYFLTNIVLKAFKKLE